MKMFTNFVVCCGHKMFIKCLIFIKFVNIVVFQHLKFYKKNDLLVLQASVETLFK